MEPGTQRERRGSEEVLDLEISFFDNIIRE
jgi:hypothetical protein